MNISAVNCTPIKPQSFKGIESNYNQLHIASQKLSGECVDSKDIKKPLAIATSLAALVGVGIAKGRLSAVAGSAVFETIQNLVAKYKGKGQEIASEVAGDVKDVASRVATEAKDAASKVAGEAKETVKNAKLGVAVENGLKKAATFAKENIAKLRTVAEEGKELTKFQKIKNVAADVLDFVLDFAKNAYKKIAYSNIDAKVVGDERAKQAFENVAGVAGAAVVVPDVLSRDADGDGVKDILQKSQNAYTRAEEKFGHLAEDINAVGEVLRMLS